MATMKPHESRSVLDGSERSTGNLLLTRISIAIFACAWVGGRVGGPPPELRSNGQPQTPCTHLYIANK